MGWAVRFLIPRDRSLALPVFAVLASNYQPSNLTCSAEILGRGAEGPEKTAIAIVVPG
jgi:hypothetical protein